MLVKWKYIFKILIWSSYHFWSWGQDIDQENITDTTSNSAESVNARLNRNAPTSYQNFSSAAKHVHASHLRVLDSYCAQFNFNGTPGRKRKQTTTRRWISLSDKCDEYHNQSCEYQIDNLIKFLLECSEDSPDPTEPLERDPENDVVLDWIKILKISPFFV